MGNISVSVDAPNGLADMAILVGERAVWRAGVGFEAWYAVLRALLDREGFRKVTGGAVESNKAMVRIMEKSDMQADGRRRRHLVIDGKAIDVLHFAAFSVQRNSLMNSGPAAA